MMVECAETKNELYYLDAPERPLSAISANPQDQFCLYHKSLGDPSVSILKLHDLCYLKINYAIYVNLLNISV